MSTNTAARLAKDRKWLKAIKKYKYLYMLGLPGIIFFIVFKYIPMFGIIVAFQNYSPIRGVMSSAWVGFDHFARLFSDPDFWKIFRNTIVISALTILVFPAPILFALLLNEVRSQLYRRTIQTLVYLPHFLSWVIIVSLSFLLLSSEQGLINKIIGYIGWEKKSFMMDENYIYPILVLQGLWKDVGWGTIIYLAAIVGVNPSLYEAATIDGAGRFAQIKNVTIPSIMPTIIILFILSLGNVLEVNFEQLYLMQNSLVIQYTEVFDTYVYKMGIRTGQFSYSTAVGLFKSVVGLTAVLLANKWANRMGHEGIW